MSFYSSSCSTFNQYFLSTLGFQSTISFSESLLFTVLKSPPVQRTLTLIPENQPRSIHGTSIPAGPSQLLTIGFKTLSTCEIDISYPTIPFSTLLYPLYKKTPSYLLLFLLCPSYPFSLPKNLDTSPFLSPTPCTHIYILKHFYFSLTCKRRMQPSTSHSYLAFCHS
ncbi:hypothetical protein M011DRAFT_313184 [Sporormia fimetaria CBS 119925]|uniref:Uncharacterized protein n=1 Tax=Sporormia fimetaria CBS 119925 TaxID=1340428 RepID=A0A6A6VK59_9PLEO|nr:hypothetical protein M011DRAFT_313184 [Sporormia fimetaria CBS 119925]